MGYRRVTAELLWDIYSRGRAAESNREIAATLGLDKKTVNQYVSRIAGIAIPDGLDYIAILERLSSLIPKNEKPKPASSVFEPLEGEIAALISGSKEEHHEPMKAKTAWAVISSRHGLAGKTSYESFKRFVRDRALCARPAANVIRIETEPGKEVQIDYGRVGARLIRDRRRSVQAFCGILSCSRLPYIRFGLSQDEVAFAQSVAGMFTFYGGATERIGLDNLKAGILSADIYDPTLNRTFAELCEHYGVIADPARVASPKDKGKVERFVQVARELYRMLDALHPEATLDELNECALLWCRETYGSKKHGTTGLTPNEVFDEIEKPCLKPLPAESFVAARWTRAKVHPDQFVLAHGKYYGLPAAYIGRHVEVRSTPAMVTLYFAHRAVRQYPVTEKRREYLSEDFPAYALPFQPGSYVSFLIGKADTYGTQAGTLIRSMLEGGGNLALRRAQGCLSLISKHSGDRGLSHVLGKAIAGHINSPDRLRILFEADAAQNLIAFPISETGKAMIRGADYYVGTERP
ncbi:MAG: IS21 family transposase [Spirochaetaceae bacterium]|nr:IS21 family transposase [Spirochaetaceae bacterium]